MKISTANGFAFKYFGEKKGTEILANAGFEAMDYSLTHRMTPWEEGYLTDAFNPEFADHFKRAAKVVTDHGIELYQSHAPYCSPGSFDPEKYSIVQKQTIRAIYATAYMECPNIVAHPVLHPDFNYGQNRNKGLQTNLEYFGALVPALKDTGVTMCIENLFWGIPWKPKIANACSDAKQLIRLIDTLNDLHGPHFAACLDTGHAMVTGNDPVEMLRALGKRTRVLHVQDNNGSLDDHWIPGKGIINWPTFLTAMREIGYSGTFNFEVTYYEEFIKDIYSVDVFQAASNLIYTIGRSMVDIAEGAK